MICVIYYVTWIYVYYFVLCNQLDLILKDIEIDELSHKIWSAANHENHRCCSMVDVIPFSKYSDVCFAHFRSRSLPYFCGRFPGSQRVEQKFRLRLVVDKLEGPRDHVHFHSEGLIRNGFKKFQKHVCLDQHWWMYGQKWHECPKLHVFLK